MVWKLQVGAGVSSRWAELDSRSMHFLHSIFHLIQSPGNLHSKDFRNCGSSMPAEMEAGVEFINMEVPTERLAGRSCDWACPHPGASWEVLWCHSSLLSLEASCKMCLLLRGLGLLWCRFHAPPTKTFIFDGVGWIMHTPYWTQI